MVKPGRSTISTTSLATVIASGLPPNVLPCVPHGHAGGRSFGREAGGDRKAVPQALGARQNVGSDAGPLIGGQMPRPANACLDFIQDQQEAMTVAQCPDLDEAFCRKRSNAAFSLNRFDQDARRLDAARGLQRLKIAEGHMVESADRQPKTLR